MHKLSGLVLCSLILTSALFPIIYTVRAQVHHESWDNDIEDMLAYIKKSFHADTMTYTWQYPEGDQEKYELFLKTSEDVEIIREQNKDRYLLDAFVDDPTGLAGKVMSLIDIWHMQYSVNTESMFGVLSFLKMTSESEVDAMVTSFESRLVQVSIDIGNHQIEFKSAKEVKEFVELRKFSGTIQSVNWEEAANTMEIQLKTGTKTKTGFTLILSIYDCVDAMYNHIEIISKKILGLSPPSSDPTDLNIVQEITNFETKKVEFGKLVTDFARIVGELVGENLGQSIGLSVGTAVGASFAAAFPPAPVIGAAVGYFAGGIIVGELAGQAATTAAEILTYNLIGQPLSKTLFEYGVPVVSADIEQVYSEGDDYDVSTKEKIYLKVVNNDPSGSPERELVVSVNPSYWEITDYWDIDLERIDFDNTKTVKLKPGESEIIWFTAIPDGLHTDVKLTFKLWHREIWPPIPIIGSLWAKQKLVQTYTTLNAFHSEFAFTPIDIALVLDRSGSMSESMGGKTKIQGVKDSAKAVIDSLMTIDRVSVVSFCDSASIDTHLLGDFNYAKSQIDKLASGGSTSFGLGLSLTLQEFKANGEEERYKSIIFMSDGWHNTDPAPNMYVDECKRLEIPIYTVGLGASHGDVNEALLRSMAAQTGGEYLFAPSLEELQDIFLRFSLEVTGWKPTNEFSGVVFEDQTVVAGTFDVPSGTSFARVTLNWPGSNLDLIIVRPDGSEINLVWGIDNLYSGDWVKPEWVILFAPNPGTWTVKVYGKEINSPDEPFTVWISSYVPPIQWDYLFEDAFGRGTALKIDVDSRFFQFITTEEDFGARNATFMFIHGNIIRISHDDEQLRLIAIAVVGRLDICIASAYDRRTDDRYLLIDKAGVEVPHRHGVPIQI